jgi:SAM-dependent methyltransferase
MSDHPTEPTLDALDAQLADQDDTRWNAFYANRARPCPFFHAGPDENLAQWLDDGSIPATGRALDLGCGNGRNAVLLAQRGFAVDAVDLSQTALDWAAQRVAEARVDVTLLHRSVFDLDLAPDSYDLVYDGGLFHHIAPHRRAGYVECVTRALAPGGRFGLACFRPEGGSGYSDDEVYRRGTLGGGLGYTEARLRSIWSAGGLRIRTLRQMQQQAADSGRFGETFLWVMLAQKEVEA